MGELYCHSCGTAVDVEHGTRGWMYICQCENEDGQKAAPLPYQGKPADAHASWDVRVRRTP